MQLSPFFILLSSQLISSQSSPLPGFNIFPLRNLIITGKFDGLTFLPTKNSSLPAIPPPSIVPTGIHSQHNGTLELIGNLVTGGKINAICTLNIEDQYFLYVGGDFLRINKHHIKNIAMYNLQDKTWHSLGKVKFSNEVLSLACDNQRQLVHVGAKFYDLDSSNSQSGGIFDWDPINSEWNSLPFKGVNGPVNSIVLRKSNNNVIIGGKFTSTLDSAMNYHPLTNEIDLRNAEIKTYASSNQGRDHPDRFLCENNQSYDMANIPDSQIIFKFPPKVIPSGIRIWNKDNRDGVQKIRIFTYPNNQPIPVAKITPNGKVGCGIVDGCWLNQSNKPQEFMFSKTNIPMSDFRIKVESFYGKQASIKKIQVFSFTTYAPAYPIRNQLDFCQDYQPNGPKVITKVDEQPSETTSLPPTIVKTLSYQPQLLESGYYKISIHRASDCLNCHAISIVDIKISPTYSRLGKINDPITKKKSISESLTEIYTGYFIDSKSNPTEITINYSYFKDSQSAKDPIQGIIIEKVVAHDQLPNLLEFIPFSSNSNQSGVVDGFSQAKQPAMEVTSLTTDQDTLYIGGRLPTGPQIAQIYDNNYNQLLTGYRGEIKGLSVLNQTLYAGGDFEVYQPPSTFLKYLTQLDLTKSSVNWASVENLKTDHPITSFYSNSTNNLLMTGQFNANYDETIKLPQLHYVDYNTQLKNLSSYAFIEGDISSITHQPATEPYTFFVGQIRNSEYVRATNVVYLTENGSVKPIAATPDEINSSVLQTAELNVGLMYIPHLTTPDDRDPIPTPPLIVVGGKSIPNKFPGAGIYEGNRWKFLDIGQGEVKALSCSDNELFLGGDFDAGPGYHRLIVYSFKTKNYVPLPTPLSNSETNRVNKLIRQYGTTKIIVSGQFDSPTGNSDCNHLCLLDADLKNWVALDKPLPGEVQEVVAMVSFKDRIVLSSNKMNKDNELYVYDIPNQKWTQSDLKLPGFPQYLSYDNATRGLFVAGKTDRNNESFIYWWNEVKSHNLGGSLRKSPAIKEIMVYEKPLTSYDEINLDFKLPPQGAILVSGDLILDGFGPCSAALFNGSDWQPYITTSQFQNEKIVSGEANIFRLVPFFPRQREYFSTLFIILISLGISLGILILIIGLGLILLLFQFKRRQRSRASLQPLLSDVSNVDPITAQGITSPLNSPINPPNSNGMVLNGNGIIQDTTTVNGNDPPPFIPMKERSTMARSSSNIFPDTTPLK